ncbi:HAMP domain-containing protein [Paenibacillus sp. CC-CFT747]|nr:HAMP domain-containing protein [Paenibacillus sp. CC-CFT747]
MYQDGTKLKNMWHAEAQKLKGADAEAVDAALRRLQARYDKASMFWVDGTGRTRLQLPEKTSLPEVWTSAYTVKFMKESYDGDPYTVVAFIGGEEGAGEAEGTAGASSTGGKEDRVAAVQAASSGFMVLEVPRSEMKPEGQKVRDNYSMVFVGGTLLILSLFLFVSLLFFYRIRRRLVRLQAAMTTPSGNGIPQPTTVENGDEIGKLESAFNDMVGKLETSRLREAEEEALRRDLIAKLSHDLRTPLTTIRGLAFRLKEEPLSPKGRKRSA